MRLGHRRGWFWFLVAWCAAADLVAAAITARPGLATIIFLATSLVALEGGLATTRRKRIVTLVTALVMATVVLVAAFAATAKPSSGILLGATATGGAFQFSSFELQATSAVALGGPGIALLVVTLLLGLQLSRTNAARALGRSAASRQNMTPAPAGAGPSPALRPAPAGRPESTLSAGPDASVAAPVSARPRAGTGRGRRRPRWRRIAQPRAAEPQERRPASQPSAADHPARASTLRPGPSPPLQQQHVADSNGGTERHGPLSPSPGPPGERSRQEPLNGRSPDPVETRERGPTTAEQPSASTPGPADTTPRGGALHPSAEAVVGEEQVQPHRRLFEEAGGSEGRRVKAEAAGDAERATAPPAKQTLVQGARPSPPAGEPLTEPEHAMRAALARLAYIREDLRPRGVRGAMDLDGLVCRLGASGSIGPISACIRPGELLMFTCDGPPGRIEAVLSVLHGDRPLGGGQAMIGGFDLRHVRSYTVRRLHRVVGYVGEIDGRLTSAAALDSVLLDLGLVTAGPRAQFRKHTDVIVAMHAVGLESRLGTQLAELSPLDQRLVAFAAALVHSPSILLVDDPTADLDRSDELVVEALLRRLQAADVTVVVGTSDPRLLRRHRGRVLRL